MKDCELNLPGCFEEAEFVAFLGAGGDTFACGPCMNAAEDDDQSAAHLFVPIADLVEFAG